jgi:hypothetical protein
MKRGLPTNGTYLWMATYCNDFDYFIGLFDGKEKVSTNQNRDHDLYLAEEKEMIAIFIRVVKFGNEKNITYYKSLIAKAFPHLMPKIATIITSS